MRTVKQWHRSVASSIYDRFPLMFASGYNDGDLYDAYCRRRHAAEVRDIAEFKAEATRAVSLMEGNS